jgi:hypothetical protein
MTGIQDKPVVLCRCCNELVKVDWQPSIVPGKPGYWLYTCLAPKGECDLAEHTFSSRSYENMDLTPYLQAKA